MAGAGQHGFKHKPAPSVERCGCPSGEAEETKGFLWRESEPTRKKEEEKESRRRRRRAGRADRGASTCLHGDAHAQHTKARRADGKDQGEEQKRGMSFFSSSSFLSLSLSRLCIALCCVNVCVCVCVTQFEHPLCTRTRIASGRGIPQRRREREREKGVFYFSSPVALSSKTQPLRSLGERSEAQRSREHRPLEPL